MRPAIKDTMDRRQSKVETHLIDAWCQHPVDHNVQNAVYRASKQNGHPVRQTTDSRNYWRIVHAREHAGLQMSDGQWQAKFFLCQTCTECKRSGYRDRFARLVQSANDFIGRANHRNDKVLRQERKALARMP